jgi:hypothetical protein
VCFAAPIEDREQLEDSRIYDSRITIYDDLARKISIWINKDL